MRVRLYVKPLSIDRRQAPLASFSRWLCQLSSASGHKGRVVVTCPTNGSLSGSVASSASSVFALASSDDHQPKQGIGRTEGAMRWDDQVRFSAAKRSRL